MIKRSFTDLWAGLEELTRELANTLPAKRRMAGKDLRDPVTAVAVGEGLPTAAVVAGTQPLLEPSMRRAGKEGNSYRSVRSSHPLSPMGGAQPVAGGQEP